LPLPIAYWLLWNPPAAVLDTQLSAFVYLVVLLIVFRLILTCFDIPGNAMVPELTRDYDQRTRMMSARISTAWISGLIFTVAMYGIWLEPTNAYPDGVLNRDGYQTASVFGAVLILASIATMALGTHRHVQRFASKRVTNRLSLGEALATVASLFKNPSFRALILFAVVYTSADGMIAALWIYLASYFWGLNTDQIALINFVNLFGAVVAMAVVPVLARRRDKRGVTIVMGLSGLVVSTGPAAVRLIGWLPDALIMPVMIAQGLVETFFIVAIAALIGSMIADVVEEMEVRSGVRQEGGILAAQTFVTKVATAVGTWLAGVVLALIAFPQTQRVTDVPQATLTSLATVYVAVLAASMIVGVLFLRGYRIDRSRHARNLSGVA
jgi:Na+/melibiose symporter-like transporter